MFNQRLTSQKKTFLKEFNTFPFSNNSLSLYGGAASVVGSDTVEILTFSL